ncbi:MAG: tRNA pseudouridine(55) synthase TruB [Propionibacteriaceae bacterium]|nr:tRNA pseudouridine(55) synthase TruB [Propionibacteriaceae bacterium]
MSQAPLVGFVLVDKPLGWTSHQVVGRLRRLLGQRQIGHAGTLDPLATGLLVCGVGSATRLLGHVMGEDKTYIAQARFGIETTTDDAAGQVVAAAGAAGLTVADLERAAAGFRGDIEQTPSAVSAIKVDGRRAYDLVRQGQRPVLQARPVHIARLVIGRPRPGTAPVDAVPEADQPGAPTAGGAGIAPEAGAEPVAAETPALSERPSFEAAKSSIVSSERLSAEGTELSSGRAGASDAPSSGRSLSEGAEAVLLSGLAKSSLSSERPAVEGAESAVVSGQAEPAIAGTRAVPVVDVELTVDCSAGTYIRALARDLGRAVGAGAHLIGLRRTRSGPLTVDQATVGLAELEAGRPLPLLPVADLMGRLLPTVTVDQAAARRVGHGQALDLALDGPTLIVGPDGLGLAVYVPRDGLARPQTVLATG